MIVSNGNARIKGDSAEMNRILLDFNNVHHQPYYKPFIKAGIYQIYSI